MAPKNPNGLQYTIESATRTLKRLKPNPYNSCSFKQYHSDGSECEYCTTGKMQRGELCPARESNFAAYKKGLSKKIHRWQQVQVILSKLTAKKAQLVLDMINQEF